MTPELEGQLRMVVEGDRRRAGAAAAFLATLTPAEHTLVRDGAAHGYTLGWSFGATNPSVFRDVPFPHDADIIADAGALTQPPLSPTQLWNARRYREYWLFREAAVMGFVLGDQHGGVDTRAGQTTFLPPAPEWVLHIVVEHCQSTSDLYPILGENLGALTRKILKRQTARFNDLVAAIGLLAPTLTDRAAAAVTDMVDDGELVETPNGLTIAPPDHDDAER